MADWCRRLRWCQLMADDAGVALVITLVIVALVAITVLELNYLMRVDLHAASNFRDGTKAYYLAKSGVYMSRELLGRDNPELNEIKNTLLAGASHTMPLGDGTMTVRLIDETGKININALASTSGTALQAAGAQAPGRRRGAQAAEAQTVSPWIQITQDLFQRLGIDPLLVGALIDWVDTDDLATGPGGAESNYYRGLEKPYSARNGAMETIAELHLIRGFTDEVLLKLGARRVGGIVDPATNLYLTVLPAQGEWQVNINTAPQGLLASLTREAGQFAEAIVRRRAQLRLEKIDDLQTLGITGEALQDFQRLGTVTSLYYTVDAQGTVGDMIKHVTALIRVGGDQASQTLYWRVQ